MRFALALALALCGLLAIPAPGQEPAADLRLEVDSRSVFSTIRQRDGANVRQVSLQFKLLRGLDNSVVVDVPPAEFVVEEDGKPVNGLQILQPRAEQLSVVLAMDISGSMARAGKMEEARKAALTFLGKLDPRCEVGLILFDHEIRLAIDPVRDPLHMAAHRRRLEHHVQQAQPQGGTAYMDASLRAIHMLKGSKGRRAVVVMTDGVDMNSTAKRPQVIEAAVQAETPVYTVGIGEPGKNDLVTTVLVLDHSGSMLGRASSDDMLRKIDALKVAAKRYIELMRPGARTTLLPFSDRVSKPEPFTNEQKVLASRIDALEPSGGTSLYDATLKGVETLLAGEAKGRRAVVVLTDGKDEAPGSNSSDEDVIERAREARIPLYMLGLGETGQINEPVMQRMARETRGEYYHAGSQKKLLEVFETLSIQLHDDGIDEPTLGELANNTGGRYTHVSKVSELQVFYEKLAEELQSTYKATFESQRASHDGTARGIDIKVVRQGKVISSGGNVDDVARGVLVPQLSYGILLVFLALFGLLVSFPGLVRKIYRGFGGT